MDEKNNDSNSFNNEVKISKVEINEMCLDENDEGGCKHLCKYYFTNDTQRNFILTAKKIKEKIQLKYISQELEAHLKFVT